MVFYWSLQKNIQKKTPIWRTTKQEVADAEIVAVETNNFTIRVKNREVTFVENRVEGELYRADPSSLDAITWLEKELIKNHLLVAKPVTKSRKEVGKSTPLTSTERSRRHRAKKKMDPKPKNPPLTNAERQARYRAKKKIERQGEPNDQT